MNRSFLWVNDMKMAPFAQEMMRVYFEQPHLEFVAVERGETL